MTCNVREVSRLGRRHGDVVVFAFKPPNNVRMCFHGSFYGVLVALHTRKMPWDRVLYFIIW